MAQAQYPYLDLTVLDPVRKFVVAPSAALIFSRDLDRLLWANGEGTQLIGSPAIRPAIEGEFSFNPAMARQIKAAADKLDHAREASAIMRVRTGFKTRLVGFNIKPIALPDGESGLLLLTEGLRPRNFGSDEMAAMAVAGLDGYSHASAIVDAGGAVVSGSEHFAALGVEEADLKALVAEVSTEDDRLVKRPVATQNGPMPSGIARLRDEPALHLLVIASNNPADTEIAAPRDDETKTEPSVSSGVLTTAGAVVAAAAMAANTQEADTPSTQATSTDDASAETAVQEPGPKVGAFSSKRGQLPSGAFSRWYYNAAKDAEADPQTSASNDAAVSSETANAAPSP
ncbi:MAG: hypothetical protein AAGM04_00330, partial [Pseudomonadota bacterium]